MAFKSETNTLSTTSEVIFTFPNEGTSVIVRNNDASIIVYLGGPDVTTSNGFPLAAGASIPVSGYAGEILYAVAASGTPVIRLLEQGI